MINFAEHTKTLCDMFKNEDFERLLVRYTAQGIPAGETLQHFCDRHKVPYNLFNKWYRDTRHKVVKVEVDGKPCEPGQAGDCSSMMESVMEELRPQKTPVADKRYTGRKPEPDAATDRTIESGTRIMIDLRTTDGLQIRRRGMTYPQFLEFAKNLSVLC